MKSLAALRSRMGRSWHNLVDGCRQEWRNDSAYRRFVKFVTPVVLLMFGAAFGLNQLLGDPVYLTHSRKPTAASTPVSHQSEPPASVLILRPNPPQGRTPFLLAPTTSPSAIGQPSPSASDSPSPSAGGTSPSASDTWTCGCTDDPGGTTSGGSTGSTTTGGTTSGGTTSGSSSGGPTDVSSPPADTTGGTSGGSTSGGSTSGTASGTTTGGAAGAPSGGTSVSPSTDVGTTTGASTSGTTSINDTAVSPSS